nr:EAL domain-containing protein [uncultured Roseateles sp.]
MQGPRNAPNAATPTQAEVAGKRWQLFTGISVIIGLACVMALAALFYLKQDAEQQAQSAAQHLARSLVQTFDGMIDMLDLALQDARDEVMRQSSQPSIDVQAINRYLIKAKNRLPNVSFLRVTDAQGQLVYGTEPNAPPVSMADREFFKGLRDDARPDPGLWVANAVIAKTTKRWVWTFARRINGPDGRFKGTIYASIYIDDIERLLSHIQLGQGGSIALRDRDLGLIARQTFELNNPIPIGNRTISNSFRQALANQPDEGTYVTDSSSLDPVSRSHAYHRSLKYGFLVNVGTSTQTMARAWWPKALGVGGLVALFALALLVLARQINQSWHTQDRLILQLRAHTEQLAQQHQELAGKEEQQRLLLTSLQTGIVVHARDTRILFCNPAAASILGLSQDQMLGKQAIDPRWCFVDDEGQALAPDAYPVSLVLASGQAVVDMVMGVRVPDEDELRWVMVSAFAERDEAENIQHVVVNFHDITEMKNAESRVWSEANFDALTKLPNRRLFQDRVGQAIKQSHRDHGRFALLFIDLDHFKEINDTMGHDVGDQLLVEAAQRIRTIVRDYDTVARLGGDEFTVILTELHETEAVGQVAEKIINRVSEPYLLRQIECYVSASIGIALYPDDGSTQIELTKNADQAMYAAKSSGRQCFRFFTKPMQEAAMLRMHMAADLRRALGSGQIELHYQPIVDLANGHICKAEALLRWRHPDKGLISPADFIPVAEETGIIHELGDWVFHQAVLQVRHWTSQYDPAFQISINKSPVQFSSERPDHRDWIDLLSEHGVPGHSITIEITEGVLMGNDARIAKSLLQFRDAGIAVAIDDFGTGYSSLSYLKKFDIDFLKIDQSFTHNLRENSTEFALCEAIVVMAHKLGIKVIAEGVETEAQGQLLSRMGCDYGQGYLFSKALSAQDFERLLKAGPVGRADWPGEPALDP